MSVDFPAFIENAPPPGWVRVDEVRQQLGIKHAQMQRIRKDLGNLYEHQPDKPGKPAWLYGPLWWPAWARLTAGGGDGAGVTKTTKERIEEIKLRHAELDLADRERSAVNVVEFFRTRLAPCLDEIRLGVEAEARNNPALGKRLADRLERGIQKLQANGHSGLLGGYGSPSGDGGGEAAPASPADAS